MSKPYHTSRSSFNWQSDLSDERKDQIIAWVKSLSEDEQQMLQEIIDDVEQETYDSQNPDL